MEVIERKYLVLDEVKEILEKVSQDNELKKKTYEYVSKFTKIDKEKAYNLIEELKKLDIIKLTDELIFQIANILPKSKEELRAILKGSKLPFREEEVEKIFEIIRKYL